MQKLIVLAASLCATGLFAGMNATVQPTHTIASSSTVFLGNKRAVSGGTGMLGVKLKNNAVSFAPMKLLVPAEVVDLGDTFTVASTINGGTSGTVNLPAQVLSMVYDQVTCTDFILTATPEGANVDLECCCDADSDCNGGVGWSNCGSVNGSGSYPLPDGLTSCDSAGSGYLRAVRGTMQSSILTWPGC